MSIGDLEVGQHFLSKGKAGAIITIISKEVDRVKVRNHTGREYYLPVDYDPNEKITSDEEIRKLGEKAMKDCPFANPVVTEKPRNNGKPVAPKRPKVREKFLELLRAGATRAEVNEKMKDTSVPILFNYTLERLEERGITITRPADKKTGKYYATGQLLSKGTAAVKDHPRIAKLSKKARKNLK